MADAEDEVDAVGGLALFEKFYEEAESEDRREKQTEDEARRGAVAELVVNAIQTDEDRPIGYRLVKLSRVAGQRVDSVEDDCPRDFGR